VSRPTVPTCDQCGRTKGETNHWWMAHKNGTQLVIQPFVSITDSTGRRIEFLIKPMDLCSEQCVNITVGKWMRGELEK